LMMYEFEFQRRKNQIRRAEKRKRSETSHTHITFFHST
jgi:hypothetical protein